LHILSYGAVSLSNIGAINNGQNIDDGNGQGVYVTNTGGTYAKSVIVSGVNVFNYNDGNGLYVVTDGAISVSKPIAYYNGYNGLHLDNTGPFQANVTIGGFGQFSYNGNEGGGGPNEQAGLDITTQGTVTLANITATYNYGSGAYIDTYGLTSAHAVTLTGTNTFSYNGNTGDESGLIVMADGKISVSNITAYGNFYRGATLNNEDYWTAHGGVAWLGGFGGVTITGFGNFSNQTDDMGLFIDTHGSITLSRVTADNNVSGLGMELFADGNIVMTCTVSSGNFLFDVLAIADGTITIKGLLSYTNAMFIVPGVGTTVYTTCP
jgi:hypothetical protein